VTNQQLNGVFWDVWRRVMKGWALTSAYSFLASLLPPPLCHPLFLLTHLAHSTMLPEDTLEGAGALARHSSSDPYEAVPPARSAHLLPGLPHKPIPGHAFAQQSFSRRNRFSLPACDGGASTSVKPRTSLKQRFHKGDINAPADQIVLSLN